MKSLSLRAKLIGAIGSIICLASAPFLYYAYHDVLTASQKAAEEKFDRITQILEEDLSLSYLNGQTLVAEKIEIEKTEILRVLDQIERAVVNNRTSRFDGTLDFIEGSWGSHVLITDREGRPLVVSALARKLMKENADDYLGIPLSTYLRIDESSIYRDLFTFFRVRSADGGGLRPYLAGIRKIETGVAVVFQDLSVLEAQAPEHERAIEGHLIDTVRTMMIGSETSFHVLAGDGHIIAGRGEETPSLAQLYLPAFRDKVRERGGIKTNFGEGDTEEDYRVKYFAVLDWYIHASIPKRLITEPAEHYAVNALAMIALVLSLVAAAGYLLVTWFLQPLKRVSHTARVLEGFDFRGRIKEGGFSSLVTGLPLSQKDEIGDVSRAMTNMVSALEKNIDELKTSIARQHSIEGELNAAREIQIGMLPDAARRSDTAGIRTAALMEAAREVGGDFYDVFTLDENREVFVLGDVSGKGVSAALFMCVTLTLLRNALKDDLSPARAMQKVNRQLADNNPNCMFVTLWIGVFDKRDSRLHYANGGHPAPAVIPSGEGPIRWLRELSGPLVGVFSDADFLEYETELAAGEVVFVYSDGVSEAMNEKKSLFGEAGMEKVFDALRRESPQTAIDRMLEAIVMHRGTAEQSDDITMLVFQNSKDKVLPC